MSNPPKDFNTDASYNKFKGTYFNNDIDVSGGNIICRTGNLYLAPNSHIYSTNNTIEFDDVYYYVNIPNNFHVLGQHKLLYNSVDYDVGYEIAKIQPILDDKIGTMSYYTPSDFNTFNNIYCAGQIQYLEYGTGNHIDLVPIVLDSKSKLTNISFDGNNTTTISGLLTLPANSINSSSINNTTFVPNTGNSTIAGVKTFSSAPIMSGASITAGTIPVAGVSGSAVNLNTAQTISATKLFSAVQNFSSNLRLDGSLLVGTLGNVILNNANLQKIAFISDTTSAVGANLTSLQSQITTLSTNSVSTSASNIFTGATNQFSNTIRLDGSLVLNANTLTIPNSTLQKLQYCSTISSDIQTQTTNNATNISTNTNNITTNTNNITTNTDNITTNSNNITTNTNNINTANTNITNNTNSINTANTNITNNTNSINTLNTQTTGISYTAGSNVLASITNITNDILKAVSIEFTGNINNVSATVLERCKNITSDVQTQFTTLSNSIQASSVPVGTVISHISPNLQTTTNNSYVLCNGQSLNRTTYSALFALIGLDFGFPSGQYDLFNVPNYQGIFLRGWNNQTQNSVIYASASNRYTFQADATQDHTHGGPGGTFLINSYQTPTDSLAQGYYKGSTSIYNRPASQTLGSTGYMNTGRTATNTYPANYLTYYYIKT